MLLKQKILVVEDDITLRTLCQRLLAAHSQQRELAVEIHLAPDGLAGLEVAEIVQPNVIITDIRMPRMTGLDLTRTIRADTARYGHPIIFVMSGWGQLEDFQQQAYEAGANLVFSKPLNIQVLLDTLDHWDDVPDVEPFSDAEIAALVKEEKE